MSTFQNLLTENKDGISIITINRPDKLNALNRQTIIEIGEAVKQAIADKSVAGIIITGSGPKAFVAGADSYAPSCRAHWQSNGLRFRNWTRPP